MKFLHFKLYPSETDTLTAKCHDYTVQSLSSVNIVILTAVCYYTITEVSSWKQS